MLELVQPGSVEDIRTTRELFREYAASLGEEFCFLNFEQELRDLPGEYAPPAGRLFLARMDTALAGCVGLRRIDAATCEMKRLYVRPSFRGQHLGRTLANTVIQQAREIGYSTMRLDTLPSMREAVPLYESLGFTRIPAYNSNPIPGVIFMELKLA
ncbi:MAG TPA: GNAT family N-acetyltransferase [Terriglobia bacterium]|nr:GNAT family N-acetyltransferase [Terriglobia bacterium]